MGKRSIDFDANEATVRIREDDAFATGAYTCDNKEGRFVLDKGPSVGKLTGNFLPSAGVILLDGVWFQLQQ